MVEKTVTWLIQNKLGFYVELLGEALGAATGEDDPVDLVSVMSGDPCLGEQPGITG